MKIQRIAQMILMAAGLSTVAAAQVRGGGGNPLGNLKNDIRPSPTPEVTKGHGAAFAGPIADGGSVFVDLGGDERLVLTVDTWVPIYSDPLRARHPAPHRRIRLMGGTPGDAGAILVSLDEPALGAKHLARASSFGGVFAIDGSIEVVLPELEDEVFVQGVEATPIGNAYSGIKKLVPPGHFRDPSPSIGGTSAISDAVRRATKDGMKSPVQQRFFGAARMAGVQGFVEATVVFGPTLEDDGFALYLGPALAQRVVMVDLDDDGGATFHFRTAEELVDGIESVLVISAFADAERDLALAHDRVSSMGAAAGALSSSGSGKVGTYGGAIGNAGDVSAPEAATAMEVGFEVLGRLDEPERAGGKQDILDQKTSGGRTYSGSLGNAGDVAAPQGEEEASSFENLGQIAPPDRAGDKNPLPKPRDNGASRYLGGTTYAGAFQANPRRRVDQGSGKAGQVTEALGSVTRMVDLLRNGLSHSGGHGSPH